MRVIAIQTFQPPGLTRPIRPGETLDVDADLAHAWLADGLAIEVRTIEPAENATVKPAEAAVQAPAEKAIRKPRETAAHRKR